MDGIDQSLGRYKHSGRSLEVFDRVERQWQWIEHQRIHWLPRRFSKLLQWRLLQFGRRAGQMVGLHTVQFIGLLPGAQMDHQQRILVIHLSKAGAFCALHPRLRGWADSKPAFIDPPAAPRWVALAPAVAHPLLFDRTIRIDPENDLVLGLNHFTSKCVDGFDQGPRAGRVHAPDGRDFLCRCGEFYPL